MRAEHIRSTHSTRKNLVLLTYLYVWYGPVEVYTRVFSTWHGPVEEIRTCIRKVKQYVRVYAYVARATGICTYLLSTRYVLWIFASNSVYVEARFHDCVALMMKDHPHHGHSFIAHHSPVSTDHSNQYILPGISFLLSELR